MAVINSQLVCLLVWSSQYANLFFTSEVEKLLTKQSKISKKLKKLGFDGVHAAYDACGENGEPLDHSRHFERSTVPHGSIVCPQLSSGG